MSRGIHQDRLVHYLAGECSEEEKAEIEAWMEANPAHREHVQELRRVWKAAGRSQEGQNVDAMWDKLSRRMELPEATPEVSAKRQVEKRLPLEARRERGAGRAGWEQPLRTVAFVAFIAALAFLVGEVINADRVPGEAAMREVATEAGERARVKLGDGTQVVLNAESKLTLPAEFAEEERVVRLQGEAYFEVAPDKERPFVVLAGGTVTRVLGTKFSVGAYPDEDVQVVVAEGKVAVRQEEAREEQGLLLTRRQMARLSKRKERVQRREVDPGSYLAWTEGRLIFRDASFQEVARKLERWYGLQVKLEGAPEEVDHLNASFKEEPVAEVLQVIAESLQLRYERTEEVVTFYATELQ